MASYTYKSSNNSPKYNKLSSAYSASSYKPPGSGNGASSYKLPSSGNGASSYKLPSSGNGASSYKPPSSGNGASSYKSPSSNSLSSNKQPITNESKAVSNLSKGAALALHQNVLQTNGIFGKLGTNISYKTEPPRPATPGKAGKPGKPATPSYSIMLDERSRPPSQAIKRKDLFRFDTPHDYKGKSLSYHTNSNPKLGMTNLQKRTLKALDHVEIPKPVKGFNKQIYNTFRNFDNVGNAAKVGGKALGVFGAVMDGKELYDSYQSDGGKIGKNTVTSAGGIAGSWGGAAVGAKGGAMGGAALGTMICPGLGTAIGGFVGGLAGGILGGLGGRWAGEKVADTVYNGGEV